MMWLTAFGIAAMVVLDQLSKWWATAELLPVGSVPLIPGVLQLRYVLNDGAAFSMLAGRQGLLIAVTAAAMLVMLGILLLGKAENGVVHWSLAMIVGGGIGNLIDRVLNGVVVDYFEVLFMEFAVFNVADCFVVVGCILLFIGILFSERIQAYSAKKKGAAIPAADGRAIPADKTEEMPDAE